MSNLTSSQGSWRFILGELRPKGRVLTWFNGITAAFMLVAAAILIPRFVNGLGAVSNVNQVFPWGVWKGFSVISGVALAGGAYVVAFMVYILGLEQYRPIVRAAVLNGFLAYVFYVGALLLDLGKPWNVINPIIGNSFGFASVMFLVAWSFLLYMIAAFTEFSPAIAEWLGKERLHKVLEAISLGAVLLGVSLSTLHQAGLGALYLMAGPKLHPLWYSEFIPLLFFVSSIFAGLSMVIFEGSLSQHYFRDRVSSQLAKEHERIILGLARIASAVMFVYLFLQALAFMHGQMWRQLHGFYGAWYLLEILGFVVLPMLLFMRSATRLDASGVRVAAVLTMLGVILNRLNVSVICFKWYEPVRYVPTWMEIVVLVAVICAQLWVFRWFVRRMPVLAPLDTNGWESQKGVRS